MERSDIDSREERLEELALNGAVRCAAGLRGRLAWGRIAWALCCVVLGVLTAQGQINTATIDGTVMDASRAILPGAQVSLTSEGMGVEKTAVTNSNGSYSFTFLLPGTYDITVQAKGFGTFTRRGIAVLAADVVVVDAQLTVAAATQTVTVTGAPSLLNLSTSSQVKTTTNLAVTQLPQPKQDWTQLMNLGTGIVNVGSVVGAGSVMMNGLSPTSMSITIDGTNGSSFSEMPSFGFYQQPNIINTLNNDAIQEVSVVKGIIPASVGSTLSGNINLITKSGSNQFHGDVFELNDISALDARNPFLATKPRSTFNQFGGSLGGPIIKNKLFFFGSYESARLSQFQQINGNSPTPYLLSILPALYADNFKYYPAVAQPAGNPTALDATYTGVGAGINNDANTVVRGDYFLSPSNQLTVRYTRQTPYKFIPRFVTVNDRTYTSTTNMTNVNFVHSKGRLTSSTRFGYNELYQLRIDKGWNIGLEQVDFTGIDNGGEEYYELNGGTYTSMEDVTYSRGHHLIQFGGIVQRLNSSRLDLNTAQIAYGNLSDFQNNIPNKVEITFDIPTSTLHTYQSGLYLQDDYTFRPNLTLNFGVRYDVFTVPKESDGRIFNRGIDPSRPQLGYGFGPYRPPSSIFNGDFNNIQPRIGFAWSLGSDRKTVVRSGFGVFTSARPLYAGIATEMSSGPNVPFRSSTARPINLAAGLGYPLPNPQYLTTLANLVNEGFLSANIASFSPVATNNPDPYSMQWMFGVERDLGWDTVLTVDYVGNRGLKMTMNYYGNLPDRLTGVAPDPTFADFLLSVPIDSSSYEALQTNLAKRFSNGLMFNVNYTYSSNIAYCVGDATNWGTCFPQDSSNFRADLGPTPYNLPQNFNESVVYQVPFAQWSGMHGHMARALIDGWQVSEIVTATSGFPLNVTDGSSSINDSRPDLIPGAKAINSNYRSTRQYLNAAAFSRIPAVQVSGEAERPGDLKRDYFQLPANWNVQATLAKSFAFTERTSLQLRADMLDAFNHNYYGGLGTNLNSSTFGKFTTGTNRLVQLGARFSF